MDYKLVILVRQDIKLPKGKLAVQCSHAAVEAVFKSDKRIIDKWRIQGSKKVVLKVKDLDELKKYYHLAKRNKLTAVIITDAGRTVIAPGTVTCCAIGPAVEQEIDKVTGLLKMV